MRPNILLLLSDQHRHDWVSTNPLLSGGRIATPHLDWLASGGMRFDNCICAAPLCGPSRACLASGVFYDRIPMVQHERDWDHQTMDSFYRILRDKAGYHVIGSGKFDLNKFSVTRDQPPGRDGRRLLREWGFSDGINNMGKWDNHGTGTPENDPYSYFLDQENLLMLHHNDFSRRRPNPEKWTNYTYTRPTDLPDHAYNDNWLARNAMDLIAAAPPGQPWFCQVNFAGPHEPLDITRSMDSSRSGYPEPVCHQSHIHNHDEVRRNYTAMIENIDARIGDFIETLKDGRQLENTIIIYSSDHGEMLGDHNRWSKKCPYQASIGVPLFVRGPGIRTGTCKAPVSLIDLAATCLDYAGLPVPDSMQARSLRPTLESPLQQHRSHVFAGLADWRVVFDGRYKLITGFDTASAGISNGSNTEAPPLLFDLIEDPHERQNLTQTFPNKLKELATIFP